MSNHVASEAIYSATYVKNYLDSVENLPDDVQRHFSRIRDIDVQYRSYLREVDHYYEQWRDATASSNDGPGAKRVRSYMARIQQNLIAAQELGDEKLHIVNQLQELIDQKTRQLDLDFKNLDYGKEEQVSDAQQKLPRPVTPVAQAPLSTKTENQSFPLAQQNPQRGSTPTNQSADKASSINNSTERVNKRSRRPRNENSNTNAMEASSLLDSSTNNEVGTQSKQTSGNSAVQGNNSASSSGATQKKGSNSAGGGGGKKKKRKARGQSNNNQTNVARDDTPPPEETIDPDEPTYCLCDQISFGEMILCDNDLCPIEWFHFSCVSLGSKPKGKWYCPNCRGDRPNVMKPKAQFLKELERYNKEKEEKT